MHSLTICGKEWTTSLDNRCSVLLTGQDGSGCVAEEGGVPDAD
jgi:hypothetical protein